MRLLVAAISFTWVGIEQFSGRLARGNDVVNRFYEEAGRAWGDRVAGEVRGRQRSSRMAGQTGSRASNRNVEVWLGTGGLPFVGWMEFGGPRVGGSRRNRRAAARALGGVTRYAPRPYVHGGRSLYPTLARNRPPGLDAYRQKTRDFLDDLASR